MSDFLFRTIFNAVVEIGHVPRANLVAGIVDYHTRLAAAGFAAVDVTDATSSLPRRIPPEPKSLAERGAPGRTHGFVAEPCCGSDLQAAGSQYRHGLQNLLAGLGT